MYIALLFAKIIYVKMKLEYLIPLTFPLEKLNIITVRNVNYQTIKYSFRWQKEY